MSGRLLSLSTLTVRGTEPWDVIDCAHECGYTHAGFRFRPVIDGEPLLPIVGHPEHLLHISARMRATGIKVLDIEFFWIRPDTIVRDFEPYFEAAQELGASSVLCGGADPDRKRLLERWHEVCELAARHFLRPHLEFMPMTEVKTYADAISVMKAVPHPSAAVMIDPLHFDRGGSKASEILRDHWKYFGYAQLCDGYAERPTSLEEMQRQAKGDRLAPGRGGIDLPGILRALPPDLPLSLEAPVAATEAWTPRRRAQFVFDATQELLARVYDVQRVAS